jgi:hypothetical protein
VLIGGFKVLFQISELRVRFLELVYRHCISHRLNKASVRTSCNNVKRLQPNLKTVGIKYLLELRDHLRGELFLLEVISTLNNRRNDSVLRFICKSSVVAFGGYLSAYFFVRLLSI